MLITTSFKSLPIKLYSTYQRKLVLASLGILIGACTDSPVYNFTNSDYGVLVLYAECVENLCNTVQLAIVAHSLRTTENYCLSPLLVVQHGVH